MKEINFVKTTIDRYNRRHPTSTDNNVYFIEDTQEIVVGNMKFGNAFIIVDDTHPLPSIGRYGYMYLDKTDGFAIKVWDDNLNEYTTLPLATSDYIKTIRRGEDAIIGIRGTGEQVSAALDYPVTLEDIDTLFPDDETN